MKKKAPPLARHTEIIGGENLRLLWREAMQAERRPLAQLEAMLLRLFGLRPWSEAWSERVAPVPESHTRSYHRLGWAGELPTGKPQ